MFQPPEFLKNRADASELAKLLYLAAPICMILHLPFGLVYPLIIGPQTIDPFWERVAVVLITSLGFLLPAYSSTRPWIQAFLYFICFLYSGHLFSLVCRNQLSMVYQLGYICILAVVAFYLDTTVMYGLYALFNVLFLGVSLFYKIGYENLFFGMIITTILSVEWVALLSRIRVTKALEVSRAELQEKNRKIQSILENIQQGVFTIESTNGKIGEECSTYLGQLMQCRPEEISQLRHVLRRTDLSDDAIEQIQAAVACIIQESEFAFAANSHNLPRTLRSVSADRSQHFELDWNPVYDAQGVVVNLLVCIRDVTELQTLRQDASRGQRELQLLGELVSIPYERRVSVLQASADLLASAQKAGPTGLHHILRMVHTMKGNARSFGLLALAEAAHACETRLEGAATIPPESFNRIRETLDAYRAIAADKLGHKEEREQMLALPRGQIKNALSALEKAGLQGLPEAHRLAVAQIYAVMQGALHARLQQILDLHLKSLPQLAATLGKATPIVHIVDPGVDLQQESSEILRQVFAHLLRNSLDHGLENQLERRHAGKTGEGHIWVVLKPRPHGLEIHFHDDGRGLDIAAIQNKALEKKIITADARLSRDEIAELIFHPGFSTKDAVTDISGRGVGLDAVRHALEETGGNIRLMLDQDREGNSVPCVFVMQLPERCLSPWRALTA